MAGRARLHCMGMLVAGGVALAGCPVVGTSWAALPAKTCPLPGEVPMTDLRLYFGRDIPGGGFVVDAAWKSFAARVLTPAFPEGFTVWEGLGQWRYPHDGTIKRERSFVLERVGQIDEPAVERVMLAYRTQFKQISVGQMTEQVCGAF
jgi:hypothetical protein